MAAAIGKNLGKFKQWTGEKLGKANKTECSDEFVRLEHETDQRKEVMEKLYMASDLYLKTLEKKKKGPEDKNKISPLLGLAYSLVAQGQSLPRESPYGQAMIIFGEAQEKIANNQLDYANKLRTDYLSGLEGALNEMKELQQSRKKLESRRLDYNAKLNTVQRSKKERPELEEQMRAAELKFNESMEDTYSRMIDISNAEEMQMKQLAMFYNSELEYYQRSVEILTNIREIFNESKSSNYYKSVRKDPNLVRGEHPVSRAKSYRTHLSPNLEDHESAHMYYNPPVDDFEVTRHNSDISDDMVLNGSGVNVASAPRILTRTSSFSNDRSAPPLPSRVNKKKQVRVLYDFDGDSKDELPIRRGDMITVLDEIDEGWWIGELIDEYGRRAGMFPANYVEVVESTTPISASSPTATSNNTPQHTFSYNPTDGHHPVIPSNSLPASTDIHSQNDLLGQRRPAPPPPSHKSSGLRSTLQNQSVSITTSTSKVKPPSMPITNRSNSLNSQPLSQSIPDGHGSQESLPCRECGCTDYEANLFKQNSCNNCFHTH